MSRALSIHPSPARLLVVAGVILAPWTAWLVVSLPSTQTAHHWDLAWAGFDVALAVALVTAGLAAKRGSPLAAPTAMVAGTLLVCDAWFDLLTARGSGEIATAGAEAVLIELPLAVLCIISSVRAANPAGRRLGPAVRWSSPAR
jgi:hypothetical protein